MFFFSTQERASQPHRSQSSLKSGWKKDKEEFLSECDHTSTEQLPFHSSLFGGWCWFLRSLCSSQLDLSGEGGEEEHDGEACQKAGILDGKGD